MGTKVFQFCDSAENLAILGLILFVTLPFCQIVTDALRACMLKTRVYMQTATLLNKSPSPLRIYQCWLYFSQVSGYPTVKKKNCGSSYAVEHFIAEFNRNDMAEA